MTPSPTCAPRVLVVDPDRDVLEIFTAFLQHHGWVVLATASADAAFQLARSARPVLIIGEHPLYRSGGGKLCEDLRADPSTAGIPFIAITARADRRELEDARRSHPAGVVVKPVVPTDLLGLVRARATSASRTAAPSPSPPCSAPGAGADAVVSRRDSG